MRTGKNNRVFDVEMTQEYYKKFMCSLKEGNLSDFILSFRKGKGNENLTEENILGFALIKAVRNKEIDSIKLILNIRPDKNILTILDKSEYSALSYMLVNYIGRKKIIEYIECYLPLNSQNTKKVHLEGYDFLTMRAIARISVFGERTVDDNILYLKKHLLNYIYSDESIKQWEDSFSPGFQPAEYIAKYNGSNRSH